MAKHLRREHLELFEKIAYDKGIAFEVVPAVYLCDDCMYHTCDDCLGREHPLCPDRDKKKYMVGIKADLTGKEFHKLLKEGGII